MRPIPPRKRKRILDALNTSPSIGHAATVLEVNEVTLYRWRKRLAQEGVLDNPPTYSEWRTKRDAQIERHLEFLRELAKLRELIKRQAEKTNVVPVEFKAA